MKPMLLALLLGACAGAPDLNEFSNACAVDADCVMVSAGDPCSRCPCPNAALAASEKPEWDRQFTAAREACPGGLQPQVCSCTSVATARCLSHVCVHP